MSYLDKCFYFEDVDDVSGDGEGEGDEDTEEEKGSDEEEGYAIGQVNT